jgi:hypothetical protein
MRGTLVFVHGTGVREPGFASTWSKITSRAPKHGLGDVVFVPCQWGEHVGSVYDHVLKTLPGNPDTAELDDADGPGAWALLIEDPLFELRVAGVQPTRSVGPVAPGRAAPPDRLRSLLGQLASDPTTAVQEQLISCALALADLQVAVKRVSSSTELTAAANTAPDAFDPELIDAVARALVASILAAHRSDPPGSQPEVAFDRTLRSGLVVALREGLLPGVEARAIDVGGWIRKQVVQFVAGRATSYVEQRYADILGGASPGVGDILYYQRRGEEIRAYVHEVLARCTPPVVAVGHSLGGVILVDLLSGSDPPHVDLLVTAGSQSPLFYAIDALVSLRRGDTRQPFQPWLNIYSPADFLSFYASQIFDGNGIHDVEVELGVPFPESHSAYWSTDHVYELIAEHWPGGT